MKKLLFLLALSAPLPVWAQNPVPATQTVPATPAIAPFNWRIRLSKGQKFRTTINETSKESKQEATAPGVAAKAPIQIFETNHLVFDQEVLSSDEKGARIELVYREAKRTTDEVEDEDDKPIPEATDFKAGTRFRYTLSPEDVLSDVQGAEEFVGRMLAAYDQTQVDQAADETEGQVMRALRDTLQTAFSYSAQEDLLGKSVSTLPNAPLVPEQSWIYNPDLPNVMGLGLKEVVTATFAGREDGLVLINENAISSNDADKAMDFALPAALAETAPNVKMALSGTEQSQLKVDEKTGLVRFEHSLEQRQLVVTIIRPDEEGGKSEEVTDTVEENTSTTEMLPPETVVALPVTTPIAAPAV